MNINRPYVGDLAGPIIDFLDWVGEGINQHDSQRGFEEAVRRYREAHPELRRPPTAVPVDEDDLGAAPEQEPLVQAGMPEQDRATGEGMPERA